MKKTLYLTRALHVLVTVSGLGLNLFAAPHAKGPIQRPKLVLAIIVDQFRYDYTTRFRGDYTGGIAKLLDNGAVFVDAHQDHYPTVTAVGHATFLTGSVPATSGIVSNEWYDRATGKIITSVEDRDTKLVGVEGDHAGSSPHNLMTTTIGDEMKAAAFGESKTIGLSMKDRASILPSGHMADAAYWFDSKTGTVVSSTYYQQQLPAWAEKFNNEHWPQKSLGLRWMALPGKGNQTEPLMTLPSAMGAEYLAKWEETPYANEMLEALAERAIISEDLGHHAGIDLLTVSFSANDHLGHDVGPDSPAVKDMSIRTDQVLEKLLDAAERAAGGAQNLIVVFSADHGVAPKPEVMRERHVPAGRLDKKQYLRTLNDSLTKKFGDGDWVTATSDACVYLNYDLVKKYNLKLDQVEDAAQEIVLQMPAVARAYTSNQMDKHLASNLEVDQLIQRGYFPGRSPDVVVVMQPYYLFGKEGTSHGTPYNYDTHVPLIFYGSNIQAGTYYGHVGISDVAPTLAAMLHVQMPTGSIGHILPEVLGSLHSVPGAAIHSR